MPATILAYSEYQPTIFYNLYTCAVYGQMLFWALYEYILLFNGFIW